MEKEVSLESIMSSNKVPTTYKWRNSTILMILTEFNLRKEKFRNPTIKKKTLWDEISKVFLQKGEIVAPDQIDKKYRNLKHTYYQIKRKHAKFGTNTVRWEYFDIFEEIFGNDMNTYSNADVEDNDTCISSVKFCNASEISINIKNDNNSLCDVNMKDSEDVFRTSTPSSSPVTPRTLHAKRGKELMITDDRDEEEARLVMERIKVQKLGEINETLKETNMILKEFASLYRKSLSIKKAR